MWFVSIPESGSVGYSRHFLPLQISRWHYIEGLILTLSYNHSQSLFSYLGVLSSLMLYRNKEEMCVRVVNYKAHGTELPTNAEGYHFSMTSWNIKKKKSILIFRLFFFFKFHPFFFHFNSYLANKTYPGKVEPVWMEIGKPQWVIETHSNSKFS